MISAVLRFHIPLVKPDVRFSRIRLSDRISRFRPRKVTPPLLQPDEEPPRVVIWLLRWLIVRIMLGAGAIKLRGDPCWRDLTCLAHHYATQPIPNLLSLWLHAMPIGFHKVGELFNHFVELVAPFLVVGSRWARHAAGALFVLFRATLIAAMSTIDRQPWLIHMAAKLLEADPGVRSLLARDPLGDHPLSLAPAPG